jgi:hypothetical protein
MLIFIFHCAVHHCTLNHYAFFSPNCERSTSEKDVESDFFCKPLESAENENTIIKKIVRCLMAKNEGV